MAKEILITASIGLLKCSAGKYWMQIITADTYTFYWIEISKKKADSISKYEGIEICTGDSPVNYDANILST